MELEKMISPLTPLETVLLVVQVVASVVGLGVVIGWCQDILGYLLTSP